MHADRHARFLALITGATIICALAGCVVAASWPARIDALATTSHTVRELSIPAPSPPVTKQAETVATAPLFLTSHPRVQPFLKRYQTTAARPSLIQTLQRGSRHLARIAVILAEESVPAELAYLPVVESNFRVHAVSHAGAVGHWQIMSRTGRRYGLRIDHYVDERRDPEKATRAAARYLRYLYERFGDWHLSLAAYNTGEAKIASIRARKKIDDYWEMIERGYLPRETAQFVPRFLAAMKIATAPETYGLQVSAPAPWEYELVRVDRSMPLNTVARLSGTDPSAIIDLNPALRCGMVPPDGYQIRLPKGSGRTFKVAYAQWPPAAQLELTRTHQVRHGENPGSIARRYGVSTATLMQVNCIRNPRTLQIDTKLAIPDRSI